MVDISLSSTMRRILVGTAMVCVCCGSAVAQKLDMTTFDKATRPQDDFFQYVNGEWLKRTMIPGNEQRYGVFNEIGDRNRDIMKAIMDDVTKKTSHAQGSPEQLVADYYMSGMDSARIEELGKKPIEPIIAQINSIASKDDIMKMIASLQLMGINTILGMSVGPDAKDSRVNTVQVGGGGTSLPGRSYYMEKTPRMQKIREEYIKHLTAMFVLSGDAVPLAQQHAELIMAMEKRMAEAQRTNVENRNPQKRYNKLTVNDLKQMTFNINWDMYIAAVGFTKVETLIVGQPEYVAMLDRLLGDYTPDEWKVYLRWKVLSATAEYLSSAFVQEDFRFTRTVLNGVKEMQPRWRRIMALVDRSVGDAMGQMFVARAFTPQAKQRMSEMIENIREAFAERIQSRTWMGAETKQQAVKKLNAIVYKIGYPDTWKDYKGLDIKRTDFVGNVLRARQFARKEMMEQFGKPVDRTRWGMTPPTVNAYYSPLFNEIAFPAGILQPPFFDVKFDDAMNYGAIGGVIGHELSHGFDDSGSQYDADGNLKNWWTEQDRKQFESRADALVAQFNGFKVLDSIGVNGRLTLGENIGDLGGLTIAYAAIEKAWAKKGKPKNQDGFTPEQRFFIGWAIGWRAKYRDEALLNQIKTDPHSPPYFRVNGPLSNMPSFYQAFEVKQGDKMFRPDGNRVEIW